jgi:hypothetical protein
MNFVNQDAGEEPQSGGTEAPVPEPQSGAGESPEEPVLDAAVDAEWREPPAVLPEPDPEVVAVPVVVPAVASHRAGAPHPLLTDAARAWRATAATTRLTAVVRPRRSAEGGSSLSRLRPRSRGSDGPRRPWLVLPAVVLLALMAAFFAWVSAEPFWLAVGHGDTGTATVIKTRHGALDKRCLGNFSAADGRFRAHAVPVTGVERSRCAVGTAIDARMVSPGGREAYAGNTSGLTARWGFGLLLVLACALLIVRVSGAARFAGRERLAAVTMTFCGPLAIAVGILAAAF